MRRITETMQMLVGLLIGENREFKQRRFWKWTF